MPKECFRKIRLIYLYRYNFKIGFIFILFLFYGKYVERIFGSFCLLPMRDFTSNLISHKNGFTIFIMFPSYVFRQYYIEIINLSLMSSDIKFPLVMKLPNDDLKQKQYKDSIILAIISKTSVIPVSSNIYHIYK